MVVHTIFAIIADGIIKNVCVGDYTGCNDVAHSLYGDEAFAIEVTQYPVEEGDHYEDGEFRRYTSDTEYEVIKYIPTDSQEIETLKGENEAKTEQIEMLSGTTDELFVTLDSILTDVIPSLMGEA